MIGADPLPRLADGVVLRRLAASDLAAFQAYRHDAVLGQFQGWSATSDGEARSFLTEMSTIKLLQPGIWVQIGIAEPDSLALVGDVGLLLASDGQHVEIGFTLRRQSQGHGIATTAVREAIHLVFEHTQAERVLGITDARNLPSIRLLERVGMRKTASRRATFRGEPCIEHIYAVSRTQRDEVPSTEQVEAGQAVYTRRTLRAYDFVVLGISNRFLWKCPTRRLEEHYNKHVTANHLDVGVGTGYFLDRCRFPSPAPRIALMDLNSETLEFASRRIARYKPETYRRNVLAPISLDAEKFDSVAINYLLHCVPGSIESKSVAFDHFKALMNPNAALFGSTLLQGGVTMNWFAKRLMGAYNRKGIFSNQGDDLEGLKRALGQRFREVSVEVAGCAALFSGRA